MRQTILLITESDEIKDQIKLALYQENFAIYAAKNRQAALQLINNTNPSLILLDIDLYSSDSIEIYRLFRKDPKTKQVPITFLTDLKDICAKKKLILLSSDDYIVKPITPHNLHMCIKKAFNLPVTKIVVVGYPDKELQATNELLFNEGFNVIPLNGLKNNIKLIQEQKPKLVIINTESITEHELRLTRNLQNTKNPVPILFLITAKELITLATSPIIRRNQYIQKPYMIEDLILRIKKHISRINTAAKKTYRAEDLVSNISAVQKNIIQKEKETFLEQLNVALNHEIRNPLTSVLIGSQALISKFKEDSDEYKVIKEIEKSSVRIKEIIDSLGNLKQFIVADYINNIKMINLTESAKN